jgi:hypothetical protein
MGIATKETAIAKEAIFVQHITSLEFKGTGADI